MMVEKKLRSGCRVKNGVRGWTVLAIQDVAEINPREDKSQIPGNIRVSFVPMAAVGAGNGAIDISEIRPFSEVKKGFTNFREGDVLFAKITPCMENGKMAVVPQLSNDIGLGSTEFHVLRPRQGIDPRYLYYYVSSKSFRSEAQHYMTGAVGQKRVPANYLSQCKIPVAPPEQQHHIVEEIEKQFSRLDEAVASLERAKANLKSYKAAVLKAAVEGKLTEQWRKEHPNVEPASKLLERILTERRKKWQEAELTKLKSKGIKPKDDSWKKKYNEPAGPDINNLAELPKGWICVATDQIAWYVTSGSRDWKKYYSDRGALFIRTQDINKNRLDLNDLAYVELPNKAEGKRSLVEIYDLLVVITGANVGKVAVIENSLPEAYVSQSVGLMKLARKDIAEYLHLAMIADGAGKTQLDNMAYGMGRPVLNLDNLRDIRIPLPPLEEQKEIVSQIERRLSIVDELNQNFDASFRRAERLRQSILKKAFSGRLVPPIKV